MKFNKEHIQMIDFAGLTEKGKARKKMLKRLEEEKEPSETIPLREYHVYFDSPKYGAVTISKDFIDMDEAVEFGKHVSNKRFKYAGCSS